MKPPPTRPSASDGGTAIVVVHGIGRPAEGSIETAVRGVLARRGRALPVTELNWNALADDPFDPQKRRASVRSVAELSRLWIRMAEAGFGSHCAHRIPWLQRAALDALATVTLAFALVLPTCALLLLPVGAFTTTAIRSFGVDPLGDVLRIVPLVASVALAAPLVPAGLQTVVAVATPRARAAVAAVVRRALLLAVWPLPVLLFVAASRPILVSVAAAVLGGAAAMPLAVPPQPAGAGPRELALIAGVFAASFALAYPLAQALRHLGKWPLKLALDVARYVGDEAYRQRLHSVLSDTLATAVTRAGRGGTVVLAGHSLGTVICLDTLLRQRKTLRPDGDVDFVFVTMGSPITRLFQRFFPGLYVADLDAAGRALHSRFRTFRWINVYRPLDYVGGALRSAYVVENCRTRQYTRFHASYWDDPVVLERLEAALQRSVNANPDPSPAAAPAPPWEAMNASLAPQLVPRFRRVPVVASIVWSLGLVLTITYFAATKWYPQAREAHAACLDEQLDSLRFRCRTKFLLDVPHLCPGIAGEPGEAVEDYLHTRCREQLAKRSLLRRLLPLHSPYVFALGLLGVLLFAMISGVLVYDGLSRAAIFLDDTGE